MRGEQLSETPFVSGKKDNLLGRLLYKHRRVRDNTILAYESFSSAEQLADHLRTQIPPSGNKPLHISDRYNWSAEIKRAKALREGRGAYGINNFSLDQEKEFRKGIEMLYREFCLAERAYSYDRLVVRKKVGEHYLYKVVAYDGQDSGHTQESDDKSFVREGLIGMLQRGIESSSIPSRDSAYKKGMLESYKGWIGDFDDPFSDGRVRVHLSPPPPNVKKTSREGYGTHSFINFNITQRIDENRLRVRVVNLRTELALEQQLQMVKKLSRRESRKKVDKLLFKIKMKLEVCLEEVLSLSLCLQEPCDVNSIPNFIDESYRLMLDDSAVNKQYEQECARETHYLSMLLEPADIAAIKTELESIQELYIKALSDGANEYVLRTIVDYLEFRANILYAKYKRQSDKEKGVKVKRLREYYKQAQEFNVKGNDSCRSQSSEAVTAPVIEVSSDGNFAYVNGRKRPNPVIRCPDCGVTFRRYEKNKENMLCPNGLCEYNPCTKMGKLRAKNIGIQLVEVESKLAPRQAHRVIEEKAKNTLGTQGPRKVKTQGMFYYDEVRDAYFTLILGAGRYYVRAGEYERRVQNASAV